MKITAIWSGAWLASFLLIWRFSGPIGEAVWITTLGVQAIGVFCLGGFGESRAGFIFYFGIVVGVLFWVFAYSGYHRFGELPMPVSRQVIVNALGFVVGGIIGNAAYSRLAAPGARRC